MPTAPPYKAVEPAAPARAARSEILQDSRVCYVTSVAPPYKAVEPTTQLYRAYEANELEGQA